MSAVHEEHKTPKVEEKASAAEELPVGPGGAEVKEVVNEVKQEIVSVEVLPLRHTLLKGVVNSTHVLLNVKTGQLAQAAPRIPLNLAIVLDRSGSMEGTKLHYAKEAIINCINSMREEDFLHLITYSENVTVEFHTHTIQDKEKSIAKVRAIRDHGSTDISKGILEGAAVLQPKKYPNHSSQIFLFSDGEANVGIKTIPEMEALVNKLRSEQRIRVDSFGIGDGFDANMMKAIAAAGTGKFYFLESPTIIPKLVNSALNGLLDLVGQHAKLNVQGLGSSMIKEVEGFEKSCLVSGIVLGDLEQKNSRKVLLEVEVNVSAAAEKTMEVMRWALNYVPIGQQNTVTLTGTLSQETSADQQALAEQPENNDVRIAILHAQSAKRGAEVERLVRAGKQKAALEEQQKMIDDLKASAALDSTTESSSRCALAERSRDILVAEGTSANAVQHSSFIGYTFKRNDCNYTRANVEASAGASSGSSAAAPAPPPPDRTSSFLGYTFARQHQFADEELAGFFDPPAED